MFEVVGGIGARGVLTALGRVDVGLAIRVVLGLGDGAGGAEGGGVRGGDEFEQWHGWLKSYLGDINCVEVLITFGRFRYVS